MMQRISERGCIISSEITLKNNVMNANKKSPTTESTNQRNNKKKGEEERKQYVVREIKGIVSKIRDESFFAILEAMTTD